MKQATILNSAHYCLDRGVHFNWMFLGVALVSPWIDERPVQAPTVPEVREYRLCWYANNKIGGEFSPIQKVTVAP